MSAQRLSIFVPINKIDEEQRLVYGQVAAGGVKDNAGETFDYEGSKPYFEKWSENAFQTSGGKSHGNVRVMHTSKVAGIVASPLGFNDNDQIIEACAKVVDDAEWEMVKAGGYTGFSMGGRYVSRLTKDDGTKSYIADPCEISLVDKPCIPTATFSVVKADGIVEEHRFRDDLYQKSDAGGNMYEPTNDEMLPVAQSLAKAAGKTEADWLEFMDAARADLIAKHDGGTPAQEQTEIPAENVDAPAQADEGADDANKADNPFPPKKKDGEEEEEADGGADADAKGAAEEEDEEAAEGEEAEKSDAPELQQGWRAKDGSFHLTKGDARAHNKALEKAAAPGEPSLADTLKQLAADAEAIAKGEVVETPEGEAEEAAVTKAADVLAVIGDPLTKFKAFLADDLLAKSLWDVERLASIVGSIESLHCSLTCYGEGDGSPVAPEVFDHLKGLGATLVALATEEVKEIVARSGKRAGVEVIPADGAVMALAASTLGLEKADLEGDLAKRAPDPVVSDTLAKLDAAEKRADEAVQKATKLEGEMAEISPLVKSLQEQMDLIKKMPMPKAPTTSVQGLGKGEILDGNGGTIDISKADANQLADAAIRLAHTRPMHVGLPAHT